MKSFALASQRISIATNLFAINVYGTDLTRQNRALTVAGIGYTRFWYFDVCKQLYFGIVVLIYAVASSYTHDILSDGLATPCAIVIIVRPNVDSMDTNHDEILRLCENPLQANSTTAYDVWKLREKLDQDNDHRSRRKGTRIGGDKLSSYDDVTAKKKDTDNKLKDTTINYSCLDEYCKVSAPKPTDDTSIEEVTTTRPLKTNTAFGHSKISFDKFAQQHIGGDITDYTLTQPLGPQTARCPPHVIDSRIRSIEGTTQTSSTSEYYDVDGDETLKCCEANIDKAVDYCTCMFCVKGLYYHITKDSCPENDLVEPCSCTPVDRGCVKRWSALGVLAIFVPCLLCYPVARSCTEICKCYNKQQASMKGRQERRHQTRNRR